MARAKATPSTPPIREVSDLSTIISTVWQKESPRGRSLPEEILAARSAIRATLRAALRTCTSSCARIAATRHPIRTLASHSNLLLKKRWHTLRKYSRKRRIRIPSHNFSSRISALHLLQLRGVAQQCRHSSPSFSHQSP